MAHIHGVYDTDTHFIVDPVKKELTVAEGYAKVKVIQHDHNSERFTFELPRYIEGHDMSTCNKVEVHYLNIDSQTKEESKGLYPVDDLQVSPENEDIVICSWLISHNATKFVGSLYFVLRLACTTDDTIDYALNTLTYEGIYVGKGIYNADAIATEYADVLEKWKKEIIDAGGVTDEQIVTAVNNYLIDNPMESTGNVLTVLASNEAIVENGVCNYDRVSLISCTWNNIPTFNNELAIEILCFGNPCNILANMAHIAFVGHDYNAGSDLVSEHGINDYYSNNYKTQVYYINTNGETVQASGSTSAIVLDDGTIRPANDYLLPELNASKYYHIVFNFHSNGEIVVYFNGYPCSKNPTTTDFVSWDFSSLLEGFYLFRGAKNASQILKTARLYNKCLTKDEIRNNLKYEATKLGY